MRFSDRNGKLLPWAAGLTDLATVLFKGKGKPITLGPPPVGMSLSGLVGLVIGYLLAKRR
jgi:hypothetical protein